MTCVALRAAAARAGPGASAFLSLSLSLSPSLTCAHFFKHGLAQKALGAFGKALYGPHSPPKPGEEEGSKAEGGKQ